jgi:hypothetical protein
MTKMYPGRMSTIIPNLIKNSFFFIDVRELVYSLMREQTFSLNLKEDGLQVLQTKIMTIIYGSTKDV